MARYRKMFAVAAAVTAVAVIAAGCSSSKSSGNKTGNSTSAQGGTQGAAPAYNAAFDKIVNPSTKTGGVLRLGSTSDCDSWDPKIAYYGWCWNMQRLFTRSLIGYQVVNGTQFKLAPDLATDMGTHNADFTQWTFTLKQGLKWSNGQPITPKDVKYGLERTFASAELPGGPFSYFVQGIKAPKNYPGPYKGGDLDTITTTDTSITINLASPNSDFDYLMAMAASAPVPYKT
jgi:peptide/nickel transport system substrate-binding protein